MHRVSLIHIQTKANGLKVIHNSLESVPKPSIINKLTMSYCIVLKLLPFLMFFLSPNLG
jgi:hypothetical protein